MFSTLHRHYINLDKNEYNKVLPFNKSMYIKIGNILYYIFVYHALIVEVISSRAVQLKFKGINVIL